MWQESLSGIEQHLLIPTKKAKLNMIAELPQGLGGPLSPKMDHLVCFLPGAIALGATNGLTEAEARALPTWTAQKAHEMHLARELMKSCWAMYAVTATGLAPEIVWFQPDERAGPGRTQRSRSHVGEWKDDFVINPPDAHNLQRPETLESLLVLYRTTEDPVYRRWGWTIFDAFRRHAAVEGGRGGYTSLADVERLPPPRRDDMESFWLVSRPQRDRTGPRRGRLGRRCVFG